MLICSSGVTQDFSACSTDFLDSQSTHTGIGLGTVLLRFCSSSAFSQLCRQFVFFQTWKMRNFKGGYCQHPGCYQWCHSTTTPFLKKGSKIWECHNNRLSRFSEFTACSLAFFFFWSNSLASFLMKIKGKKTTCLQGGGRSKSGLTSPQQFSIWKLGGGVWGWVR